MKLMKVITYKINLEANVNKYEGILQGGKWEPSLSPFDIEVINLFSFDKVHIENGDGSPIVLFAPEMPPWQQMEEFHWCPVTKDYRMKSTVWES